MENFGARDTQGVNLPLQVTASETAAMFVVTLLTALATSMPATRNVLLIGVDDLRPDIAGPYGQSQVKTPNIDRCV